MAAEKILLRRKVAAELASLSVGAIDRLIRDGKIKTVRVGRAVLIHRDELDRLGGPKDTTR